MNAIMKEPSITPNEILVNLNTTLQNLVDLKKSGNCTAGEVSNKIDSHIIHISKFIIKYCNGLFLIEYNMDVIGEEDR